MDLEKLDINRQIMFAASMCERMLPFYVSTDFHEDFNHKTLPKLRSVLDYIWEFSTTDIFEIDTFNDLLQQCQEIISEIEDKELCGTPENTAPYAIFTTLELCITKKNQYLKQVCNYSFAIIDQTLHFLIDREAYIDDYGQLHSMDEDEEKNILENHYLLEREMQKRMEDYQTLVNTPVINATFARQFRINADPDGIGIVDAELIKILNQ
jgi:uncharacterized protein YjaG (DUF416 family)